MKMTLSQIALSKRLGRSPTWIRNEGELVTALNGNAKGETWARVEYASGRLSRYELVSSPMPSRDSR